MKQTIEVLNQRVVDEILDTDCGRSGLDFVVGSELTIP
jgi:hypothetical protein